MLMIRRSNERGHFDHGWLDTRHTFSFGDYQDPKRMGFRKLRVINEDRVRPGKGFPTHPHRDMEILTCVLAGRLEHKDSMGNGSVIEAGEWQRMTAGTGVTHSEHNPSRTDPVHLFQIWILPERDGLEPGYEQRAFPDVERRGALCLVASPGGRGDSLALHQDVRVYDALLAAGDRVTHPLAAGRHAWIQVAAGRLRVNGVELEAGDGTAVSDESTLDLRSAGESGFFLFDLP